MCVATVVSTAFIHKVEMAIQIPFILNSLQEFKKKNVII